jgi:hypothetical protein
MDESDEYRVTRNKGRRPDTKNAHVIFRHLDEALAWRFYDEQSAKQGYVIALWRPDGSLIAFHTGLSLESLP